MEFTRQRKQKSAIDHNAIFLIASKQPLINKIVAVSINGVMWTYMVLVYAFFISAFFNTDLWITRDLKSSFLLSNAEIQSFALWTLALFLFFLGALLSWRTYNKRRFGSLKRRVYPIDTTMGDMLELNLMSEASMLVLKGSKVVIFEKNPITPLQKFDKMPKPKHKNQKDIEPLIMQIKEEKA